MDARTASANSFFMVFPLVGEFPLCRQNTPLRKKVEREFSSEEKI